MTTQTGIDRLEKKVDLLSKALQLLLFKDKERIPKKEAREIEKRLSAYIKGDRDEFIDLEDALLDAGKNTQKSTKRA